MDKAPVMTIYNVTRRSIELYSPPETDSHQYPHKDYSPETTRECENLDKDTRIKTSERSRDYRPLIGPVENSRLTRKSNVPNVRESKTLGSTYLISKPGKHKERETSDRLVKRIETNLVSSPIAKHDETTGVRSNVTKTLDDQCRYEVMSDLLSKQRNSTFQQNTSSNKVNTIHHGNENPSGQLEKQHYLGALCDNTISSEGRWTPQAKSYYIALTDTSEVDETTTTEMSSDSRSEDSGNEADVSFMSEWDDNLPIRSCIDHEYSDKVPMHDSATPKRTVVSLSETSPKPKNYFERNITTNVQVMAKPVTPKHKVHLDVKEFFSLPNSPTAILQSPLQKVSSPSPSHFKQLFDKLKASAGKEKTSSPTVKDSHIAPSKPDRPLFRTPTTVPRVKPRKRLDLNHNEDVEILTIDEPLDKEKQTERLIKRLIEPKSKAEARCADTLQDESKVSKVTSPVSVKKKIQTFDQLFAEMRGSPEESIKLQGDKIHNKNVGVSKDLNSKNFTNPQNNKNKHSHSLAENEPKSRYSPQVELPNMVQVAKSSVENACSRPCNVVDNEKGKQSPVRNKGDMQEKDRSKEQFTATSSPVKNASQSRITSTPCKVNSPMPNLLDISVIQGPETCAHSGRECEKIRQEDLHVKDRRLSKGPPAVKLHKLSDDRLKNMQSGVVQLDNRKFGDNREHKSSHKVFQQITSLHNEKDVETTDKRVAVVSGKECISTTPTSHKYRKASQHDDTTKSTALSSDEKTPVRNYSRERKKNANTPKGKYCCP